MKYILISLIIFSKTFATIQLYKSHSCHLEKLTLHEVKNIFLKKINTITPINNREDYSYFLKHYLHTTSTKMNIYWTRMVFTGSKNPPLIVENAKELSSYPIDATQCYLTYSSSNLNQKLWERIDIGP